jgi:hypothetical protein
MSKIMWILGLVLAAVGILLGAKSIISPGQMQIYGLTPETAAVLFVGGVLSLGMGSVINGLSNIAGAPAELPMMTKAIVSETVSDVVTETPTRIPGFGRKAVEAASVAAGAVVAETASVTSAVSTTTSNSVADTIAALEQAKSDIKTALGGVESMTDPQEHLEPVHAVSVEPVEEVATETELFVVEEKIIRGRPSRILSDDTVEAETDEGWMRFENLEHLNEYLDSMEPNEA